MRIGILSDTHTGRPLDDLGPGPGEVLASVDLIVHTGDVTGPLVLDWMEQFGPLIVNRGITLTKEEYVACTRTLNAKGWGAPHWPVEYGGTGWGPMKQYIFLEELQRYPAPQPLAFGVNMVGPVIYTFGNAAQKARYLPRILNLDDWWCQGFSEPGAGSDLASLKTKAVRDGDH